MFTIMKNAASEKQKLRMTRQRRVLLEVLEKAGIHPTADDIYRMVRRRLPHISLGTVYRNLELLCEKGVIRRVGLGGSQRHFDRERGLHYHVRCVRCGRVDDVPIKPAVGLERAARKATGYSITGHQVEFVGLCARCKTEAGAPAEGGPESE
jgi:Fur family ferric uptake transcriptional regulator